MNLKIMKKKFSNLFDDALKKTLEPGQSGFEHFYGK